MLNLRDLQDLLDLLPFKYIGCTIEWYGTGLTCVCSGIKRMEGYTIVYDHDNDHENIIRIRDRSDMINPANHFHFSGDLDQAKEWLKERGKGCSN